MLWQLTNQGGLADLRIRIEGIVYDNKLRLLPPWPSSDSNIQIVAIDETSLTELGRMPWDRDIFAKLSSQLAQMGAAVVVFDVLFAEPQKNPALQALKQLPFKTDGELNQWLEQFDYDAMFAHSMENTDVVLAMQLLASSKQANWLPSDALDPSQYLSQDQPFLTKSFQGYVAPIELLAAQSAGIGFMNSMPDSDGTIRRSPLFLRVQQKLYPSLALEAFRAYSLFEKVEPMFDVQQEESYLVGFKLGHRIIETDEFGQMLIPYQGKSVVMHSFDSDDRIPYQYTSAADVVNLRVTDDRFDQAVVFIGSTAIGLGDLQVTPVGINYPGVEIHATIFDALMSSNPIPTKPDWELGALAILILMISALALIIYPKTGPWMTILVGGIILAVCIAFNLVLWHGFFIDLSLFPVALLSVLLTFYFVARGFFTESVQRNRVKQMFGQYVPSAHIDRLLDDPHAITFDGERKLLSVMFSDIRSFTSISESMSAEQLKTWLNQFFSPVTQAILAHEGTIDKYVGDMIMAFWGAPLDDARHASHSIRAAFAMLKKIEKVNRKFDKNNLPLAQVGIGISTGFMNVGDMGSNFRRAYTVIGDSVNLGSRLEGLTKFYGLTILVSEETKQQADDFKYVCVDKVKVKGKTQSVAIFTPLPSDLPEFEFACCRHYNEAVDAYFNSQFSKAIEQLTEIKQQGDFPFPALLKIILERAQHYAKSPPDENWDGSYQHVSK